MPKANMYNYIFLLIIIETSFNSDKYGQKWTFDANARVIAIGARTTKRLLKGGNSRVIGEGG